MSEKVNQIERAALAWNVLINFSAQRKFIRYGQLAAAIGIHVRPLRYVLGVIQEYCLTTQLPPLTIIVVNQTGYPSEGFIAWDTDNLAEGISKVFNENWLNLSNPFEYALSGKADDEIIAGLISNPGNSEEIYALIKVRGIAQVIFRKALLRIYNGCAFCGFSFEEALQAAHIIPWPDSSKSERLNVKNGLLLCAVHHSLFDNGYLTVNDDYEVEYYDSEELYGPYTRYDRLITTALHKKRINLPSSENNWPNKEYLQKHRGKFQ